MTMYDDPEKKKKGYTTILLELSMAARSKVPAPKDRSLNPPFRFVPERARPEHIQQSLERRFATTGA